jgi:hypothetical protein
VIQVRAPYGFKDKKERQVSVLGTAKYPKGGNVYQVTIVTTMAERPENRESIPGRSIDFSLIHSLQIASGAHPAYYRKGTGG